MSYKQILVPVDGSQISFSAVKKAAQIAKAFDSKLMLISLVAEDPFTDADFYYSSAIMKEYFVQAHENATKSLEEAFEAAKAEGVNAETKIVKGQVSAEGIAETAAELKADLIVMGSHGRKASRECCWAVLRRTC